jgi:polyisoprenoid-binding protein YceI
MRKFIVLFAMLVLGALNTASAQWMLDKSHTGVTFSVRHMVVSDVTGSFGDFDIALTSSKDDFSDAVVEATIKVASINTNNTQRDNHLKADDFFNAEKFPLVKFKSTSFTKVADGKYTIIGDLTIRDVTKSVTFDATLGGMVKAPWGVTIAGWKAIAVINRFDFNLKWNKAIETGGLIAGQDVTITLNMEFNKK